MPSTVREKEAAFSEVAPFGYLAGRNGGSKVSRVLLKIWTLGMSGPADLEQLIEAYLAALNEYCPSPTALLLQYVLSLDERHPRMSEEEVLKRTLEYAEWLVRRVSANPDRL
jgi:hypothetical protein